MVLVSLEQACRNCQNYCYDTDIEIQTFSCAKDFFHYTDYGNGQTQGEYPADGTTLCKGKFFVKRNPKIDEGKAEALAQALAEMERKRKEYLQSLQFDDGGEDSEIANKHFPI